MKAGETLKVQMGGFDVAEGVIVEITDGKAYIDIPATRVIMGVKTSLSPLEPEAPSVDRDFTTQPEGEGGKSEAQVEAEKAPLPLEQVPYVEPYVDPNQLDSSALDD